MDSDFSYAFEVVRSGDVIFKDYSGTMLPDFPIMRCYKINPK